MVFSKIRVARTKGTEKNVFNSYLIVKIRIISVKNYIECA